MKILLTGSTGMVGRNILENKRSKEYTFLTPSRRELDLLNFEATLSYMENNMPDFVIHAAGVVGGIQANISYPIKFLVDNTDIGRNVIMASKKAGIKNLLNLSSSCVYPRTGRNPLSEEIILKGELEPTNEGYALAKIFAMRLCQYISEQEERYQYKTIIPCNLYGRFDNFSEAHSHMIPAVIKKIHQAKVMRNKNVDIWGDGTARREFMYAGDLAELIFFSISKFEKMPQNMNVGIGKDYSINEYYNTIREIIEFEGVFEHDLTRPTGMKQKLVDDSKLREFGWEHKTSLKEGISKTYEYYKSIINHD